MWRIIGGDKNVWRINFIYGMFYGCKHSRFLALLLSCLIRFFFSLFHSAVYSWDLFLPPTIFLSFFYYHRNQSCLTSTSFKKAKVTKKKKLRGKMHKTVLTIFYEIPFFRVWCCCWNILVFSGGWKQSWKYLREYWKR